MNKLSALSVKALLAAGKIGAHADGGNLYLRVTGPSRAKWTFRYQRAGRPREMGLGAAPEVLLAEARGAADEARRLLRQGVDPIEHKRQVSIVAVRKHKRLQTFEQVVDLYLAAHGAKWSNAKHRAQWRSTLDRHAFRHIGTLPVAEIGTDQVLKVLQPIWKERPETASRLRGRIEAVLDYARVRGWRDGENPARWRGHLDMTLPAKAKIRSVVHHSALPWKDLPDFMGKLRAQTSNAARALELLILTAARTGEVLGARWSEIDLEASVWTRPAEHMKARKAHRVPLGPAAVAVLSQMARQRSSLPDPLIFPGQRASRPLSQMAMAMLLRRMGRPDITVHGFRSTFRDWVEDATTTPGNVAEQALAHAIPDKVEAAYRRGDLFDRRIELMRDWSEYCAGGKAA